MNLRRASRLLVVGAVIAIGFLLWCWFLLSAPYRAPEVNDVVEISVALQNRPLAGGDVLEFVLPVDQHPTILRLFDGAKRDLFPPSWQTRGRVSVRTRSGEIPIDLYWTGESVGAFSVGNRYFRGSSDAEIVGTIVAASPK